MEYHVIDAFTNKLFGGNPAGVCLPESWPSDSVMQNIAAENNLSETAFLVKQKSGNYGLRWFTPTLEVDLCDHATLAGAECDFVSRFFAPNAGVPDAGVLRCEDCGERVKISGKAVRYLKGNIEL